MQIAVIGANGQLGSDIVRVARARDLAVLPLTRHQCDVRDPGALARALRSLRSGDVVINTAGFHKTDDCERDPDRALAVNTLGAYHCARAAALRESASVYISSDYVFDGRKRTPYLESDVAAPLSVYGATKLAGEAAASLSARCYIVRVGSLFGVAGSTGKGGNFVETMLIRARDGQTPRVVDDIVMSPTSTSDVAGLLLDLLARDAAPGTYHLSNEGACSWYEFADEIFLQCGLAMRAQAISARDLPAGALRPAYSALASEKLSALGLRPRPWRDALADYLRAKGYLSS